MGIGAEMETLLGENRKLWGGYKRLKGLNEHYNFQNGSILSNKFFIYISYILKSILTLIEEPY